MARPLLPSPMHTLQLFPSSPSMMTLFFLVISVLSIFSIITFLCGTRELKKLKAQTVVEMESTRSKKNKLLSKLNSNLSSRTISMVKMLSWRKVEAEERGEEEEEQQEGYYSEQDEQVLWKKNILMGERCRPIDFSGKVVYDSEGNVSSKV